MRWNASAGFGRERPRMYAVQAEHCAPIVNAFQAGERFATKVENAKTIASGLRVPVAVGDFILLDLIKRSRGQALVVSDVDMVETAKEISSKTGISASPEGGGALAGARRLLASGEISDKDTVVIFNTGGALKYAEAFGPA